jgi:3-isopropylmalate dehydrogenase
MTTFKITVLPGDYIGPEIIAEARRVLEAVERRFGHTFEFTEALAGGAAFDAYGEHLPQSTLAACEQADAILKGPFGGPTSEVNHPKWQGVETKAILPLRKHFDLFMNLRPVTVSESLINLSPLKPEIVRHRHLDPQGLTSGIYFSERSEAGRRPARAHGALGLRHRVLRRAWIERAARAAAWRRDVGKLLLSPSQRDAVGRVLARGC